MTETIKISDTIILKEKINININTTKKEKKIKISDNVTTTDKKIIKKISNNTKEITSKRNKKITKTQQKNIGPINCKQCSTVTINGDIILSTAVHFYKTERVANSKIIFESWIVGNVLKKHKKNHSKFEKNSFKFV